MDDIPSWIVSVGTVFGFVVSTIVLPWRIRSEIARRDTITDKRIDTLGHGLSNLKDAFEHHVIDNKDTFRTLAEAWKEELRRDRHDSKGRDQALVDALEVASGKQDRTLDLLGTMGQDLAVLKARRPQTK